MRPAVAPRGVGAPLLPQEEVAALVAAAPAGGPAPSGRRPDHGRGGELGAVASGTGLDFADLRPYGPGDDPRHIDWRATARTGEVLLRRYHADVDRPLFLLLDRRAAMAFGTRRRLKVTQAARAALWLAGRAVRGGREVGGAVFDRPCRWLPPGAGNPALRRLAELATAPCPPNPADPQEPAWDLVLGALHRRLPAGAGLVVLSDCSGLYTTQQPLLAALARHCATEAVRLVDPLERRLPVAGVLQLGWGKRRLLVDSNDAGVRDRLQAALERRGAEVGAIFARAGVGYRVLGSDEDELAPVLAPVAA